MKKSIVNSILFVAVTILIVLGTSCNYENVKISQTFSSNSEKPLGYTPNSHERFGFNANNIKNPSKWVKKGSTKLRLVNYSVDDETDCYLTFLPGQAGGILANINRWRKQLELEPLNNIPQTSLQFAEQEAVITEMKNNGKATLGLIQERSGGLLFVKMSGPARSIADNKESFFQFLKTFDSKSVNELLKSDENKTEQYKNLDWDIPETWLLGATKPMRNVTFVCGKTKRCEAYITVLGGDGGGNLDNVNRWRKQLGLEEEETLDKYPTFEVLGRQSLYVKLSGKFKGMDGKTLEDAAIIGVIADLRFQTLFIKLVGPEEEVLAEEETFKKFVSSIHYRAANKK